MAISQVNDATWTKHVGTLRSDGANSIVVDSLGNIYIAGYTEGRLDLERPIGIFMNNDSFVAKYSSEGELLWLQQFGNPNVHDAANALCLDPFGNVYVTGYTYDTSSPIGKGGRSDGYVMKFSSDGNPLWAQEQHFGSEKADRVNGLVTDSLGFVYITGEQGGFGGSISSPDVFLTKLDGNGQEIWTQTLATSAFDQAQDIAIDQNGNLFITGSTHGSLAAENAGFSDIFTAKYSADGTLLWVDQMGSTSSDNAYGIAIDKHGSVFVVGSTQGSGTSFSRDAFIAHYDNDGVLVGGWTFGTEFRNDIAYSVAVDKDDLLYVTGTTGGSLANNNAGADDVFLLVMNQQGEVIEFQQFGSYGNDVAKDIALSPGGDVYITGYTNGVLGETYFGYNDAFIAKFSNVVEPVLISEPVAF